MNELCFLLILFAFLGCLLIIYPLKAQMRFSLICFPIVMLIVFIGYSYWGSYTSWKKLIQRQERQQKVQQVLKSIENPSQLMQQLKSKLDNNPQSAKGWYLLGRVYASQNDVQQATEAFATAYHLKPNEERFAVHYVHSLWQANAQKFNPEILNILKNVLDKNPKQPDALAMCAMDAYIRHDYDKAINYWQQLLSFTPEQSEASFALRKAIVQAQKLAGGR